MSDILQTLGKTERLTWPAGDARMARITLIEPDRPGYSLPRVCVQCGRPATEWVFKAFSWYPSWLALLMPWGIFPYLLAVVFMTKRMNVTLPFCTAHRRHWLVRTNLVSGSGLLLVAG